MLEASNVRLLLDAGLPGEAAEALVRAAAAGALGVPAGAVREVRMLKRSVDARKKRDVHFVATLGIGLASAAQEDGALAAAEARGGSGAASGTQVRRHAPSEPLAVPQVGPGLGASGGPRPLVAGAGPAGLFCALYLARAGLRPLVLERGGSVDERLAAVAAFNGGGDLDPQTNIQFGEGGAGTFSDGKLTTNIKNPFARHVLRWFVEACAPEEILWQAKPHIGTDLLVGVLRTLRRQIEEAGGEVRFHAQLVDLRFDGGAVCEAGIADTRGGGCHAEGTEGAEGSEEAGGVCYLPVRQVVLACGHSARDTFAELKRLGVRMEQKPFSVGVRIEHAQAAVNRAQYGDAADHPALGAADYKLSVHLPGTGQGGRADGAGEKPSSAGRGVYTFCMCPGGEVVCAASEEGGVVVNGMSRFARDGANANSALLVGVGPEDFGSDDPLAGVELQRQMERAAYRAAREAGGAPYAAPAQTVGDFLAGRAGSPSAAVEPTYARGVAWCDLRECLPPFVAEALAEALPLLDRRLRGFADPQAVMTGVETRSSSPVRIVRDETLQATVVPSGEGDRERGEEAEGTGKSGLYPCGEGAGYAGGIMSAACDGLRVAEALARALA